MKGDRGGSKRDIITPELEADYRAFLAAVDEICAEQVSQAVSTQPGAQESQETAPQRTFNEVWIGEDGRIMYDFQVFGTGKSIREWMSLHPDLV